MGTAHGENDFELYAREEREFAISDGTVVHGWLIRDPEANKVVTLPIIGRDRFIAGYSLADVREGKVPAILYPPSFVFQAGQPDEILQAYRRAMGMEEMVEASRQRAQ